MENNQIVSRMNTYLHTSAKLLEEWLGKLLPKTSDDWWEECVIEKLSYNQRETAKSKGSTKLGDFDLAALLRIADKSWYAMRNVAYLPTREEEVMSKPQYAILRFAKYKGLEISNIEAHNARTKEKYASNPDIDISRSHLNSHLIKPERRYRTEAERQIKEAGCRTQSDSVRLVEALVTATPEFFQGKKQSEIKRFFWEALTFIQQHQNSKTIVSAAVHMDEKTPHMHFFVPLMEDGWLCAKEILGNKKKLTQWQDGFWEHMVKKFPDLERGESASKTGRDHIPPRVFKEMTRLTKQKAKLKELLSGINVFNAKSKATEIAEVLDKYIPNLERMETAMKKYRVTFKETTVENEKLKKKNKRLSEALDKTTKESTLKKLSDIKLRRDYEDAIAVLDCIPKEVLDVYARSGHGRKELSIEQNL